MTIIPTVFAYGALMFLAGVNTVKGGDWGVLWIVFIISVVLWIIATVMAIVEE